MSSEIHVMTTNSCNFSVFFSFVAFIDVQKSYEILSMQIDEMQSIFVVVFSWRQFYVFKFLNWSDVCVYLYSLNK